MKTLLGLGGENIFKLTIGNENYIRVVMRVLTFATSKNLAVNTL
jgi:hypothetical protein